MGWGGEKREVSLEKRERERERQNSSNHQTFGLGLSKELTAEAGVRYEGGS